MEQFLLDANINLQKDVYKYKLDEFNNTKGKDNLINKYKNHNMRFSVIIDRNNAKENNDLEFSNFLDKVIDDMTKEISLLNSSTLNGTINEVLNNLTFHEKVNIIFYVRLKFYDKEIEPYEVLTSNTFDILSKSITEEANTILNKYNLDLVKISKMNSKEVILLINDKELSLDILFASELVK